MKARALLVILFFLIGPACLTSCKDITVEDAKGWYVKQPETWDEFIQTANTERAQGQLDKAAGHYQQALDMAESQFGPHDLHISTAATQYGGMEAQRMKYPHAEELYRKAYEVEKVALPPNNSELLQTRRDFAKMLLQNFKQDEAKEVLGNLKLDGGAPAKSVSKKRHRH